MMAFKDILSTKRKKLNLTQKELAEKLNVSNKTISKWENGGSFPDLPILTKLAKILEIDLNELLFENADENNHHEATNYEIINKFKLKSFISIGLIIFSFIIYFTMKSDLLMSVFFLSIIISIIVVIYNTMSFRSVYIDKQNTKEYDLLYFKYSMIILHLYSLLCCSIIIERYTLVFGINGIQLIHLLIVIFLTITISIISVYINPKIQKASNIKISNDRKTKILKTILIILIILTILSIPISFIMHYLVMQNNAYTIPLPYRSLLLITYIIYMIVLKRNYYCKED